MPFFISFLKPVISQQNAAPAPTRSPAMRTCAGRKENKMTNNRGV